MKTKTLVFLLAASLSVAAIFFESSVSADVATPLAYSVTPAAFALGQTGTTRVCMANEQSPVPSFNPGDVSNIVFDPSLGNVTSVDAAAIVSSSSLVPGDFTVAQAANPNKIRVTYINGASKPFNFGDSVCAVVH